MEANNATITQIERFIRKIAQKFTSEEEPTIMTDIHLSISQDTGELLAFDFALRPGGAVPLAHVHPVQTERFEVVHGLLDRIMQILGVPFIGTSSSDAAYGYYIAEAKDEPSFLPGRAAQ